jgi:hypothetical protein
LRQLEKHRAEFLQPADHTIDAPPAGFQYAGAEPVPIGSQFPLDLRFANAPERLCLRGAATSRERAERLAFAHQDAQVQHCFFAATSTNFFIDTPLPARFLGELPQTGLQVIEIQGIIFGDEGFWARRPESPSFSMAHDFCSRGLPGLRPIHATAENQMT